MDLTYFLKCFAALFAIMSPIANLPVFLSLTEGYAPSERRKVAVTTTVSVAAGCAVVILTGQEILALFGVSLDDFRVAGGLLILLIAIGMVRGGDEAPASRPGGGGAGTSVAIYPLTVPILLGPGGIATLTVFSRQAVDLQSEIEVWAAAGAISLLLGLTFFTAGSASRYLGHAAIAIMGRIMGMILCAIAIDMMLTGLRAELPGLSGG